MLLRPCPRRTERAAAIAVLCLLAGCSDSSTAPVVSVTKTITVDAKTAYGYLALDTTAQLVSVANPTTSSAWDMGFFATRVTLNGGAAGPGGVSGYCLCGNATATDAQVQAMTTANQLAAFDSVTAAMIPAASAFTSDGLDPVINGWYAGAAASATVAGGRSWIIRSGSANVLLAKFQVTGLLGPSATGPGKVAFQFAMQPTPGAAFGAVVTDTVTVTAGAWTYFDLVGNAMSSAANWSLAFDGWNIRTNAGVSGSGTVMAVIDSTTPFASITAAYASGAPPQAYRSDAFSGVFAASPWYRYNITGSDNQIWPVYSVYLVRRGSVVFKVQLAGYYDAVGAPRHITVRYAKLAG